MSTRIGRCQPQSRTIYQMETAAQLNVAPKKCFRQVLAYLFACIWKDRVSFLKHLKYTLDWIAFQLALKYILQLKTKRKPI